MRCFCRVPSLSNWFPSRSDPSISFSSSTATVLRVFAISSSIKITIIINSRHDIIYTSSRQGNLGSPTPNINLSLQSGPHTYAVISQFINEATSNSKKVISKNKDTRTIKSHPKGTHLNIIFERASMAYGHVYLQLPRGWQAGLCDGRSTWLQPPQSDSSL